MKINNWLFQSELLAYRYRLTKQIKSIQDLLLEHTDMRGIAMHIETL